ncbi:syntaxin-like protein [Amanita rubescens]|nr:syntaxin-like protein [Amanita rubescens]
MSLPKLTSLSTQTLSLLLEQHRLTSFSSSNASPRSSSSTQILQITKNLTQLRAGILELEANEGRTDAVTLLRSQFERMRTMLGDGDHVESLDAEDGVKSSDPSSSSGHGHGGPSPDSLLLKSSKEFASSAVYVPYTDDPAEEPSDPNMMLQVQRQMMDEQDEHLDRLSQSINRQHHISLQMNDELDVHAGLLEQLDTDLDNTDARLRGARRRLDWFAKAAKDNSSAVMIAVLILVLLILIIVFKT